MIGDSEGGGLMGELEGVNGRGVSREGRYFERMLSGILTGNALLIIVLTKSFSNLSFAYD